MKKLLFGIMMVLLLVVVAACSTEETKNEENNEVKTNQESTEKSQTITFGVTPWTSTVPPTKVASLILQKMGYKVEETSADVTSVYIGLSRGDINVFMDSWMPSHQVHLDKFGEKVEDIATSYSNAASGLIVPLYLDSINSIEDLKGKENLFNNEVYGTEEGGSAAVFVNDVIESYGLELKQINSSEGAMLAQARRLMEQEKPVVFYGWRPHTMFNKLDIKVLEDPEGIFNVPSIHVIVNNGLKESAPEVYEFLSNWSIPLEDVEAMSTEIEDGKEPEKVAQEWIDNNQDKVNKMLGK